MSIEATSTTKITIRKGQGITQALKELVEKKKLKMSDGSISKAEWNETIKVLDNIQEARKKSGMKSIFGDNYSVNAGQTIEFSEDEMKDLYKAMGIVFDGDGSDSIDRKKEPPKIGEKPIPNPPTDDKVKPKPPADKKGNQPTKITPEERNKARHYGSNVADYLVGYTDDSEKGLTKEVITQHVNHRNVLDFLSGYERNKGLGDHFFKQLSSEYGFEEKQNLMKDVALKLSKFLKENNEARLAREVDVALQDNGFTTQEIKKLDEIALTMLASVPELRDSH
ncbi:MAG: hypothetical protein ACI37Q_01970 [Candidatus Gastranaerophilaceae bacterium]